MKQLIELPDTMLLDIFEYLPYEEVAKNRLVCVRFNQLGQCALNSGFNKVIKEHAVMLKRIKAQLPRRESERRAHSLARHSDILTSIETRISMLSMTYNRYIDLRLCSFIPGRVLDEILRILRMLKSANKNLRPHEVLQELRDISSMAIEHFDEKIAPNLKKSYVDSGVKSSNSSSSTITTVMPSGATTSSLRTNTNFDEIVLGISRLNPTFVAATSLRDVNRTALLQAACHTAGHEQCASMSYVKKLEADYKKGIMKLQQMQMQHTQQNRRLQDATTSIAELKQLMADFKRRHDEMETKYRELIESTKQGEVDTAHVDDELTKGRRTRKRRKPENSTTSASTSSNLKVGKKKARID